MRALIGIILILLALNASAAFNVGGQTIFTGTLIQVLEPGPDIQAIIDNITDASVDKPYLIELGPGVYDLGDANIVMKEWVSLKGAGRDLSTIKASKSGSTFGVAVIIGANNSSISNLSILSVAPTASDQAFGIYLNGKSPHVDRVNIHVDSDNLSSGIEIIDVSPTIRDISITAAGIGQVEGIRVEGSAAPVMSNLDIDVSNIASSTGLVVFGGAPEITNSSIVGTNSITLTSGSTNARIVNSKVIGAVNDNATGTQCLGTYDGSLSSVTC